jgi:hypothetical protein
MSFTCYRPLIHKITNLFKQANINMPFRSTITYMIFWNQEYVTQQVYIDWKWYLRIDILCVYIFLCWTNES